MPNDEKTLKLAIELYGLSGIHPAADIVPMMGDEDYQALVEDARQNGFLNPVKVTDEGLLIDGRNRLCASIDIELDVPITRYNPTDPVQYVVSENVKRRHLSTGQRAMIGLEIEKYYAKEAKERQRAAGGDRGNQYTGGKVALVANLPQAAEENNKSRKKAADTVGVSERTIQTAKAVQTAAPDLAEEVRRDKKSLHSAYQEAKQREHKAEPPPKPTPEIIQLTDYRGKQVNYPRPKNKALFNRTNDAVNWAWWTWNPVTGCLHGCKYCYARELAEKASFKTIYPVGFTPLFRHDRLDAPVNTTYPKNTTEPEAGRVFVCSMADLFGHWVPVDWVSQVLDAMQKVPQWEYLLLTKNPARYQEFDLPKTAWVGATLDRQETAQQRIDAVRRAKGAKIKWVSLEPLLEPIKADFSGLDWVVIGAQSGTVQNGEKVPGFAPDMEWVLDLIGQARQAGCAIYLKPNLLGQTSDQWPGMKLVQETPTG